MGTKSAQSSVSILALLAGATMWGVVWYPMRLLETAGLSGLWLTFFLYLASAVAGLVLAWKSLHWIPRRPWVLLGLALSAGWTNLAFILAVLDGNVMRVLLLFYLSPIWAVLLSWWFLKEHVSRYTVGILVVALIGALMMLWHPGEPWPWPRDAADWFALSSGFAFAVSNIFVRYGESIPVQTKGFVSWVGVTCLAIVMILFGNAPMPAMNISLILGVVALALFGMVAMTLLVQYGVSNMPVHRSAIILLFELVAGAVSQQLLTDESMSVMEWGGGLLVVVAAAMMALREKYVE
jgi:drug/metabolite transporter (DMT)-like permease